MNETSKTSIKNLNLLKHYVENQTEKKKEIARCGDRDQVPQPHRDSDKSPSLQVNSV